MWLIRGEVVIALRQLLNETVEQFEALRKDHTELEVKSEAQQKELTVAKSDRKSYSTVIIWNEANMCNS